MSTATDMLQKYLDAETAVLQGQTVRFGERWLTLADLPGIRSGRQEWQRVVDAETRTAQGGGGPRFSEATFRG